jgi:hypothetical protein
MIIEGELGGMCLLEICTLVFTWKDRRNQKYLIQYKQKYPFLVLDVPG